MSSEHHVYRRDLDPQERNSLSVLASKIAPGSRVLDLGCGTGALGQYLHQDKNCIVDGVTLSQEEAALARTHYRDVVVADLELINLPEAFAARRYDCIVCADVLEHLKQPERILSACRDLLAPDGQLLISLPNAGYSGLLMELMQGEFRYRPEGLLDRTHLRFFTRQSMLRFLADQHWCVETLETVERDLDESEFKHSPADSFPPAVVRYLLAQPDALTYQFICTAKPNADPAARQAGALQADVAQPYPSFTSNLYWADAGQFNEKQKLIRKGRIGQLHQCMRFELPRCDVSQPVLRWDPADRPGFLHLHQLRLKDSTGTLRWTWQGLQHDSAILAQAPQSQIGWQPALATAPGSTLLILSGDDPWIHLPIPMDVLSACLQTEGSVLEIELGWPMSADYGVLAANIQAIQADLSRSDREALQWRTEHESAARTLHETQQRLQHLLQINDHQQAQLQAQQQHIRSIHASRSYRVMQKLAGIKQRLHSGTPQPEPQPVEEIAQPAAPAPAPAPAPAQSLPEQLPAPAASDTSAVQSMPSIIGSAPAAAMTDIIVPVYRGLEDTRRCLESVLKAVNTAAFQLVVINDASPEPELTTWLREFALQQPQITLLENEQNLGFVGTVNRGMALHPEHDVLLLNSDTEVAGNWLDRLRTAAYREADIGTVTPLSNNATICSYPRFCENNPLPVGFDTASLDQLCAATNAGASVTVPTGVGFCMYIRRDCLTQTGLFDEEHFGKGYGEENDFCMRAHELGWRHMLALDTFVLHTGGVSFGSSKTPRELEAYKTLQQLHPEYDALVQAHLQADPARAARNAIDKARIRLRPQPRVLMVTHNVGGGTLRHVHELAHWLQGKAVVLGLTPLPDHMIRLQWLDEGEAYAEEFHWLTQSGEVRALLQDLNVQHIHFHHLLGVDPQIMRLPQDLGISYDFTAHDYYTACPQITLTSADPGYCGEQGPAQCASCLAQRPAPTRESIDDWRLRHRQFLLRARYVLAPSLDTARRLLRYFPAAHIHAVRHLDIPDPQTLPVPQGRALPGHAHLRIFIVGGVSASKGGDVMEAVALAAARAQAPVELHLIGYPHRQMRTQPHASLTIHGPYAEADLPQLLQRLQPDLVWFPALWPETYSYTLSACLKAGLPVVAPDIGAFTERLSERPWTWLRPWNTPPDAWLSFFLEIRQRHFLQAHAPLPAPAAPGSELDAQLLPWSYEHDYLKGIGAIAPQSK